VLDALVAGGRERVDREGRGLGFRLLEADDVWGMQPEELDHPGQADGERVDVPGDDLH
jgi:hypothetical protein